MVRRTRFSGTGNVCYYKMVPMGPCPWFPGGKRIRKLEFPVCAVVVTYNCGPGVGPTIRSLLPQVDRVIVVDNGSGEETRSFLEGLRTENGDAVERIFLPVNVGISGALNAGIRRAIDAGYAWVLTMDHDSVAKGGMLEALRRAIHRDGVPEEILLAAPVYMDRNTGEAGRLYRYAGWKHYRLFPKKDGGCENPTVVITSGNLVNVSAWRAVGGFDESLAIDYVDHDFCLRGGRAGFRVVVAGDAELLHTVGAATSRRMFGHTWFGSNHPAERRYTIGRNRMTMIRRHARAYPAYAVHAAMEFPADILAILICERGDRKKLLALFSGAMDSFRKANPSGGKGVP